MLKYETNSKKAINELNDMIGKENIVYRKKNFDNFEIENIRLSSTLDEFYLLLNEKVYLRPAYKVENNTVYIPSFLSYISGNVQPNIREAQKYSMDNKNICVFNTNYTMLSRIKEEEIFDDYFDENYLIVDNAIKDDSLIYLNKTKKSNYIKSINKLLKYEKDGILPTIDNKKELIYNLLKNNKKIIDMYHNFDYNDINPKYFINVSSKSKPNLICIYRLFLMLLLGFDVIIYSENDYDYLNNFISEEYYDKYFIGENENIENNNNNKILNIILITLILMIIFKFIYKFVFRICFRMPIISIVFFVLISIFIYNIFNKKNK